MDEAAVDERLARVPALLGWSTVCLCYKVSLCHACVGLYMCMLLYIFWHFKAVDTLDF